jgi:acetate---CoA ligase (ADP-forming)
MLGPLVTIANPLDYHTFIWGDGPRTTEVFTTMLAGYDAGHLHHRPAAPRPLRPVSFQPALEAIEAAQAATGGRPFPSPRCPRISTRRGRSR